MLMLLTCACSSHAHVHSHAQDAISFNPKFNFDADMNLEFDLGITLKGIDMPEFPDCLPGPAKMVSVSNVSVATAGIL